jgi:SRSO17 transposase
MGMKTNHAQRLAPETPPPSGRKPCLKLSPHQVEGFIDDLKKYHQQFAPLFRRQEQRYWALKYMEGQMLDIERKSIEPMANALEGGNVQAMQQFVSASPWDDKPIIVEHQEGVATTLGHPDGVLIVDGSDFPKQGEHSVGVSRQHCGVLGKTANCQAGVLLAYASEKGHTLLDRRLFLPEKWFGSAFDEMRKTCGVPDDLEFQTKNQLAWSMVEELIERNTLPFQWITMDEAFGRDTKLLNKIALTEKYYFAEIPCDTHAWLQRPQVVIPPATSRRGRKPSRPKLAPGAPSPQRVDQLSVMLDEARWRRVIVHEGTKGPLEVEIAIVPVIFSENGLPARKEWLIIRRKSSKQALANWKFYRSNASENISWEKLACMTAWRWPIESTIEECKGELGMDHYEVRNWRGWHHHMTMTILSHHFLVRLRIKFGEEAPALTVAQTRQLLNAVLPKQIFNAETVLYEIERTQNLNFAAYRSHRKRRGRFAST